MKFKSAMKRGNTMTNRILRISMLTALFVMSAAAGIYPPVPGDLTVSVPFDFVVGNQTLRAGEYIVHQDGPGTELEICEDGVYCVTVQAAVANIEEAPAQPQLIFQQHGDRYVLTSVWSSKHGGATLAASHAESPKAAAGRMPETCLQARELCFHLNKGLASSWH